MKKIMLGISVLLIVAVFTVPAYALPDLTITGLSFTDNPCCAGQDIAIIFHVKNQGDSVADSHVNGLYIDGCRKAQYPCIGLNAGESTGCYYEYKVPCNHGPHVIQVCADICHYIEESNDNNNCDSDNLNVIEPIMIMTVNPTGWSPTINCGESDSKIVTVSAASGVCRVEGVTVSKISGPTWLGVAPTTLGNIASGSSKTFTMTASPPLDTSGDFTYTVRVSNTCGCPTAIDETGTITVYCGPPVISDPIVTPDPGDNGDSFTWSATVTDAEGDALTVNWHLQGLGDLNENGYLDDPDVLRIVDIWENGLYEDLTDLEKRIVDIDCNGVFELRDTVVAINIWENNGWLSLEMDKFGNTYTDSRILFDINDDGTTPDYKWKITANDGINPEVSTDVFDGPTVIPSNPCTHTEKSADINGDCCVDSTDQDILDAAFGCCSPEPCFNDIADLNGDCCVNVLDLAKMGVEWTCGDGICQPCENETSCPEDCETVTCGGLECGDINGDGEINTLDITKLERIISCFDTPTFEQRARSDVNGDGKVTDLDVKYLECYMAGILDFEELYCPKCPGTNKCTHTEKSADINGDGCVDSTDQDILNAAYGCCSPEPCFNDIADLNGDCCVDYSDMIKFAVEWTCGDGTCQPCEDETSCPEDCATPTCDGTDTSCGIYPNCENCNDRDGWYCNGNTREYRDYYCSGTSCRYSVTSSDNCDNTDGWVDTGNTKWVDENECQEKEQKEQKYRDYYCSGGACTYSVTDTKWVDTGNTRDKPDGTICGCTASNTLKRCYGGVCTDTGICDSTTCGADAACDGKEPGDSCGGGTCDSNCKCSVSAVGEDHGVFRNGRWWISKPDHSGTAYSFKYGISGDKPVVGDINDDGSDDVAIFRNGWWWVSNADHSGTAYNFKYGIAGDKPVVGDIDNDGSDDVAIFRDGWWWVSNAAHTGTAYNFKYGISGDKPVVGDINGDGSDDVAIFRDGWWWVSNAAHTGTAYNFKYGISGDIPVVGDINNDGSDDVAIFRNGWWWVSNAAHTGTAYKFKYGISGDIPVVGDIG